MHTHTVYTRINTQICVLRGTWKGTHSDVSRVHAHIHTRHRLRYTQNRVLRGTGPDTYMKYTPRNTQRSLRRHQVNLYMHCKNFRKRRKIKETLFEEIIAKNSPKLMNDININIKRTQVRSNRMNSSKSSPKHTVVRLSKANIKGHCRQHERNSCHTEGTQCSHSHTPQQQVWDGGVIYSK